MSILDHGDYRSYLRELMAEKAKRNPRFSLRAMAKFLELAPSYLSTVLKGEKNLSYEMASTIAAKLELSKKEAEYFSLLAQRDLTKNAEIRESLHERARKLNPKIQVTDLSLEHFKIISDPIHFAITRATELNDFKANARNLSVALNRNQSEVEMALSRLEELEMIEKLGDGTYVKVKKNPRVVAQSPNLALRRYHRQTLEQAIESLETQTPEEKVIGSENICIGEDQIEDFRALADEFFDRALELAKKSKKKDYVYHLGIQIFNLTPNLKKMKSRRDK